MSRDILLYGLSQSLPAAQLIEWARHTKGLHAFVPDYHRLQLEHWIWSHRAALTGRVLDVGVDNPRRWISPGYVTLGEHGGDITGDLLALPLEANSFDACVLTEVLEHCTNPPLAIAEVKRILKPGGLLLVTSPFLWPDHRTDEYRDYWRFTEQAWRLLLAGFVDLEIVACDWTPEGEAAYHFIRRFECWGFADQVRATTAYLCRCRKAGES